MRTLTLIAFVIGLVVAPVMEARATMPPLTDEPTNRTAATCRAWATKQDEEARSMWGNGSASRGVKRLARACLTGGGVPEDVAAGSSAGASERYCAKHRSACKTR